jgi:preprotein translocase subunit SecE
MINRQLRRVQERSRESSKKRREAAQRKKLAERKRKEKKEHIWTRVFRFLKEVRIELKKVIWPNREEVVNYTIVVLITVAVVTTFILVLDLVLSRLLSLIIA